MIVSITSLNTDERDNKSELKDIIHKQSDIVLFPISITRFEAIYVEKILKQKDLK